MIATACYIYYINMRTGNKEIVFYLSRNCLLNESAGQIKNVVQNAIC